ncbi:MAG: GDSL-type esterase/lipase family protein [Polyangia bacterium]
MPIEISSTPAAAPIRATRNLLVALVLLALSSQQVGCGSGGSSENDGSGGGAGTSASGHGGSAPGTGGERTSGSGGSGAGGQIQTGGTGGPIGTGGGAGGSPGTGGQLATGGAAGSAGSLGAAGAAGGGAGGRGGAAGAGGGHVAAGGKSGTLQVWPLGDSITYGFDGTNAGYRGPLYNALKPYAPGMLYVGTSTQGLVATNTNPLPSNQRHNDGHSSYTINDVNNNLDGLDTATYNKYGGADRNPNGGHWLDGIASGANARPAMYPDVILMMLGTNNAHDKDRTLVRTQLHALITKLTTMRPDARLIVAQITPSSNPNNVSYNADVVSEVQSFQAAGKHVSAVDMYTNFPSDGLYSDGVHPTDKGFTFMTQQWLNGILAVMPELKNP